MDDRQRDELLVRLDERTVDLQREVREIKENQKRYVTVDVHQPVSRIVYGIAMVVIAGFIGAVYALFNHFRGGPSQ